MPRESEIYFIRLSSVIAFVCWSLKLDASLDNTLLKLFCPNKSPITFAAGTDVTAPGQIDIETMKSLLNMDLTIE